MVKGGPDRAPLKACELWPNLGPGFFGYLSVRTTSPKLALGPFQVYNHFRAIFRAEAGF